MNSLKIKKNDKVVVLSGKDKGKTGKVLGTVPSEAKVVVEGGKSEKETASAAQQEVLSEREREIVGCIVRGMTNKEIADNLFISVNTVLTHRKNISRKLNIHSVSGLTIYAIVNKLVNVGDIHLQ